MNIDPDKAKDSKVYFKLADDRRSFRFAIENPEPLPKGYWMRLMLGTAILVAKQHDLTEGDIREVFEKMNPVKLGVVGS